MSTQIEALTKEWWDTLSDRQKKTMLGKVAKETATAAMKVLVEEEVGDRLRELMDERIRAMFAEGWRDSGVRHGAKLNIEDYLSRSVAEGIQREMSRIKADIQVSLTPRDLRPEDLKRVNSFLARDARKIITISGSTRFTDVMAVAAWELEKLGNIVLSCHLLPQWYTAPDGTPVQADHQAEAEGVDKELDTLHMDKIAMSDELYVVNVEGYIGESTKREIEHARRLGIRIVYLLEEILRGRAEWLSRLPRETL